MDATSNSMQDLMTSLPSDGPTASQSNPDPSRPGIPDIPTNPPEGAGPQMFANRTRINNVQGDQINYHYNVYGNFTSVGSFPGTYIYSLRRVFLNQHVYSPSQTRQAFNIATGVLIKTE